MSRSIKNKGGKKIRPDVRWIILTFFTAMGITGILSFASSELLDGAGLILSFVVLVVIVLIGIVFDIIGVAVTSADETPFHAMASRKIPEAKQALRLLRNANRVSSFCNDVIGDVCGVISGSAATVIAVRVAASELDYRQKIIDLVLSALVAGLTVGGKACGKTAAMHRNTQIVTLTAKVLCFFQNVPSLFQKRK